MFDPLKIFLVFFIPLMVTILILPRLCRFAWRIGLIDHPGKRKVHRAPKPLIGGLVIAIAISISCPLFIKMATLKGFYIGVILLLVVGFLDDFKKLKPIWKLVAQIFAAVIIICFNNTILLSLGDCMSFGYIKLGIFAIPITVFCIVGIVNAINMIDGLDGLAGGVTLIAFTSFAILAYINNQMELMLLSMAFCGAVIAFLRYNWYPSTLFMGDAGSFILGFSLVFLSISITQKEHSLVYPTAPLLILAVPIVDALTVIINRIKEGKNPVRADKNHLHHIIMESGFNEKNATKVILLLSAILSSFGVFGTIFKIPNFYLFSLFSIYCIAYFITLSRLKEMRVYKVKLMKKTKWVGGKEEKVIIRTMPPLDGLEVNVKYHRYFVNLPFSCILENKGQYHSFLGKLINIGEGGVSLKFQQSFSIGKKINIRLLLPENGKRIKFSVSAEIVWSINEDNGYRYGLRFTDIDKMRENALRNYLHHLPELNQEHVRI